MTELYRVPRLQITAMLQTTGCQVRQVTLFLGVRAQTHSGPERPSDVFNAGERFLPAIERDAIEFINLEAVLVVAVDAELEFNHDEAVLDAAQAASTHRRVLVLLDDGTTLRGELTYLLPEENSRVQDCLNGAERFLTLRDGDRALLVHKRHIVLVVPD
jgi:hypothetical protein